MNPFGLSQGGQHKRTQEMGSKNATFNEVIRLYMPDEGDVQNVVMKVYTHKMFGKRLLGVAEMPVLNLVPNQVP